MPRRIKDLNKLVVFLERENILQREIFSILRETFLILRTKNMLREIFSMLIEILLILRETMKVQCKVKL